VKTPFFLTSIRRVLNWAQSSSLWVTQTGMGCCADELSNVFGSRYDLERFGCVYEDDPRHADLLIVTGSVNQKLAPELQALFDAMNDPKYVMALGSCACGGGVHKNDQAYFNLAGVDQVIPVDVYVPGCPPRPETIMNGLIQLQDRINSPAEVVRG
jgi:NADH-quinone oxidoreductase subunit B